MTVFGESAGAGSIMHQITAYGGTKGPAPFQRALLQSPGFTPIPSDMPQESAYSSVLKYASLVAGKNVSSVEALRALPFGVLLSVNTIVVGLSTYGELKLFFFAMRNRLRGGYGLLQSWTRIHLSRAVGAS